MRRAECPGIQTSTKFRSRGERHFRKWVPSSSRAVDLRVVPSSSSSSSSSSLMTVRPISGTSRRCNLAGRSGVQAARRDAERAFLSVCSGQLLRQLIETTALQGAESAEAKHREAGASVPVPGARRSHNAVHRPRLGTFASVGRRCRTARLDGQGGHPVIPVCAGRNRSRSGGNVGGLRSVEPVVPVTKVTGHLSRRRVSFEVIGAS